MARTMPEKQTEIYRTVVRITYLKDGPLDNHYDYESRSYEKKPRWYAGQTRTEVFGPYTLKSINQDYSYVGGWTYEYNEETKKYVGVKHADVKVEKQVLKPVLALNERGALELALDWVRYK